MSSFSDENDTMLSRQRQFELDMITERYVREFEAGRAPSIDDYLVRYPQFANELCDFAVYFHAIGREMLHTPEQPAAALSAITQKVLASIRARPAASAVSVVSLARQGSVVGYKPRQLAEAVGIGYDVLGKLDAHAIQPETIPVEIRQRLANVLRLSVDTISAFLCGSAPSSAGAFFMSEAPPVQQMESFLAAVQGSTLMSNDKKAEWSRIVADEGLTE